MSEKMIRDIPKTDESRKGNKFSICLSHDVDRVRKSYQYVTHDLRKRRFGNLGSLFSPDNPYWNFEKIMALEASLGVRSTWYFLEESIPFRLFHPQSWKLSLGRYSVNEREISAIIRHLSAEGWEIGVHGSFHSYRSIELLKREKKILEDVLGKEVSGIRQHYLNLEVPETWRIQRAAGFEYDASFGYRRGLGWKEDRMTAFQDEASGMWVLPLVIMECNLFTEAAGCPKRACEIARGLLDQAERRCAQLTVLWHPHVFSESDFPGYSEVYEFIIREGLDRGARFETCYEAVKRVRDEERAGRPQHRNQGVGQIKE